MQNNNTKRNIYILLTILCVIFILNLQYSAPQKIQEYKTAQISLDSDKLHNVVYPPSIVILTFFYFTILAVGFINLISFTIRNLKKPLFNFKLRDQTLTLTQEKSAKLMFLVILSIVLVYSLEWLIFSQKWKVTNLSVVVIFNLILELIITLLILKFISLKSLGVKFELQQCYKTIKAYLILLPILLGILFINNLFLEKIGIESSINPAIEIFLKLKNNFLSVLLFAQIALFGPIAEELLFRGFIYKLLRKNFNFIISAILCSVIFSLIHRTAKDTLPLFVLSVTLCYLYEKMRNIISPILFHIIHNLINVSFLLVIKNLI